MTFKVNYIGGNLIFQLYRLITFDKQMCLSGMIIKLDFCQ